MKNRKRFIGLLLVAALSVLTMAMPVSAATPDVVPEGKKVQEKTPLTPEGNLTLVDDISGEVKDAKQFVTLVTKNGNYFYLIIDRDDEGKETVHFLNQVDEADLLELMDEEEIEKLGLNTPKDQLEEVVPEEPEEIIVEEPVTTEEPVSVVAIISGIAVAVGFLIMAAVKFLGMKKEKKKDDEKPQEEEEYYEFLELEQEMNGEGVDET